MGVLSLMTSGPLMRGSELASIKLKNTLSNARDILSFSTVIS
jgi:hypothetical protein